MKSLKVLALAILVMVTVATAKNITMDDFVEPKTCNKSIAEANEIYVKCLENYKNESAENIIMVVLKHKILFPECNYDIFLKPLEQIALETEDANLKSFAITAYFLLVSNVELTIDLDNLYNQNTTEFFVFVQEQMPKMMVASANYQKVEK